jgi:hypothetical protein
VLGFEGKIVGVAAVTVGGRRSAELQIAIVAKGTNALDVSRLPTMLELDRT